MPGEPFEPVELGLGAPLTGLYLREDVDLRCNIIMASFVKKTIKKSHSILVDRLHDLARNLANNRSAPSLVLEQPNGDKALPSFSWQRDHLGQGHSRNASSPSLTTGMMAFNDRPLPPTPPVELEDSKLAGFHAYRQQQPQTAELQ